MAMTVVIFFHRVLIGYIGKFANWLLG